jgi:hypothetical protein
VKRSFPTRRAALPAAALAALLLVTACGSDDSDPDPTPSESAAEDDEESGLTESDLEDALLTEDDVAEVADDLEEVEVSDDGDVTGDDIVDGSDACVDFLDEDYGVEEELKVEAEFEGAEEQVYSTVELYAEGEAADELEATRNLLDDCTSFTVDLDGQLVEVAMMWIELSDLDDYDLGDEGIAVDMAFSVDGTQALSQGYTLIRVDDVLTISGVATTGTIGDAQMLPISEAAVDRLQSVLDDVA